MSVRACPVLIWARIVPWPASLQDFWGGLRQLFDSGHSTRLDRGFPVSTKQTRLMFISRAISPRRTSPDSCICRNSHDSSVPG